MDYDLKLIPAQANEQLLDLLFQYLTRDFITSSQLLLTLTPSRICFFGRYMALLVKRADIIYSERCRTRLPSVPPTNSKKILSVGKSFLFVDSRMFTTLRIMVIVHTRNREKPTEE